MKDVSADLLGFGGKLRMSQLICLVLGASRGGEAARATTAKAKANARTETSGAQAKLMHRVAGGLWRCVR